MIQYDDMIREREKRRDEERRGGETENRRDRKEKRQKREEKRKIKSQVTSFELNCSRRILIFTIIDLRL